MDELVSGGYHISSRTCGSSSGSSRILNISLAGLDDGIDDWRSGNGPPLESHDKASGRI